MDRLEQAADDVDPKTIRRMLTMTGYRGVETEGELERVEVARPMAAAAG